jgi:hypothetical protein
MMPQILASIDHNMPQSNYGSKEPRNEAKVNLMEWIIFSYEMANRNVSNSRIMP